MADELVQCTFLKRAPLHCLVSGWETTGASQHSVDLRSAAGGASWCDSPRSDRCTDGVVTHPLTPQYYMFKVERSPTYQLVFFLETLQRHLNKDLKSFSVQGQSVNKLNQFLLNQFLVDVFHSVHC